MRTLSTLVVSLGLMMVLPVSLLQSAERATLPSAQQVVAELSSKNWDQQRLAEGQLYLLPATEFPALIALINRSRDQYNKELNPIVRALILRGHAPAIDGFINCQIPGSPPSHAYFLEADYLLRQATPDELVPVAKEFAERLIKQKLTTTFDGNELWLRLVSMSGEPTAMKVMLDFPISDQGRTASLRKMLGRFNPDRCSDTMVPKLQHADPTVRTTYAQLLAFGWHEGPSPRVAASFKDPEIAVRRIFANTLNRSSSAAALDLILQGLSDEDSSVRSTCLTALGNYSGPPQTAVLRKIATNERLDQFMRQQAWSMLANTPGDELVAEAKALVSRSEAEKSLRSSAVNYLLRRDQSRWLLDAVSRVDPPMKAEVLGALARSGSTAVFDELPAFLRRAEAPLAGMVITSLGSLKDPRLLPLLISNLKDVRPEVRRSASQALGSATGRDYQLPPLREGVRSDADESRLLHAAWSRWYDLFAAVPAPAMEQDLTAVRTALAERSRSDETAGGGFVGVTSDLWSVLLRLTEDRQVGEKAVAELLRLNDKRTAVTLLDLIDSPYFGQHRTAVREALVRSRVDTELAPRVLKLLGRSDTDELAVDVLVSWRVASPTLTDTILRRGHLSERLLAELGAWKDCPVISAARKLVTDDKADEGMRARALSLLVQLGDERDVKTLAQEVVESGPASYLATRGLVRMATNGVDFAARELARILALTPRKPAGKPARPLQGKPVEEPPQKPDPAPGIIAALKERPRGERGTSIALPEALLVAVRTWTKSAKDAEQQLAGLTLLIEANDGSGVEVLRDIISDAEPAVAKRAIDAVISTHSPTARPLVDQLLSLPGLDDQTVSRLVNWYREVAKLPPAELAKVKAALVAKQEAQFGKPVRDLAITIDFGGPTAPLGAKGLKAKVQIKNIGKKPYSFIPDWLDFNLLVKRLGDEAGEFNRTLHLDFKSKISPTSGAIATVLPPGQTLSSTLTYEAPDYYFTSSAHRIRVRCGFPRSLGSAEDEERAVFTTQWIDFTFIPPLWEAIDRRSAAAR